MRQEDGKSCWTVGDELLESRAVGTSDVHGQTNDPLGLIVFQRNDEDFWSCRQKLKNMLVPAQHDRHGHEHVRHGHEVLERHNEEDVVRIDANFGRFEKGGKHKVKITQRWRRLATST